MPITFDQFVTTAQTMRSDSQAIHSHRSTQTVSSASPLSGLQKLSLSQRSRERESTLYDFTQAINQSGKLDDLDDDIVSVIQTKIDALSHDNKPLTAGMVKEVKDIIDYGHAVSVGRGLATQGDIPDGHGTAFALYALHHNADLTSAQGISQTIEHYLMDEVVEKNLPALTALGDTPRGKNLSAILTHTQINPLTRELGGHAGLFHNVIGNRLLQFPQSATMAFLSSAFCDANKDLIAKLDSYDDAILEKLAHKAQRGEHIDIILTAMVDIQDSLTPADFKTPTERNSVLNSFANSLMSEKQPIYSKSGAHAAICQTLLHYTAAQGHLDGIMQRAGLPISFAKPLAHLPTISEAAGKALADIDRPTLQQAREALLTVTEEFVGKNIVQLQNIARLASVDSLPGLTLKEGQTVADILPACLNLMLTQDAVLAPLLDEKTSTDSVPYLQQLATYATVINRTGDATGSAFSAPDTFRLQSNALVLGLHLTGVTPDKYASLLHSIGERLGPVSSHITTMQAHIEDLHLPLQSRIETEQLLSNLSRTLFNQFACVSDLIELRGDRDTLVREGVCASDEVLLAAGAPTHVISADMPPEIDYTDRIVTQSDSLASAQYREDVFVREGTLDALPGPFRQWARSMGSTIAPLSAQQSTALDKANTKAVADFMQAYFPDYGRTSEPLTPAFMERYGSVLRDLHLDAEELNVSSFAYLVNNELQHIANDATQLEQPVNSAVFAQAIEGIVEEKLAAMSEVLQNIDALETFPNSTTPVLPENKAAMRRLAQRYGILDANAIASLYNAAQRYRATDRAIASPLFSEAPAEFMRFLIERAQIGLAAANDCGYDDPIANGDKIPMYYDCILERFDAEQLEQVVKNCSSATAQQCISTCASAYERIAERKTPGAQPGLLLLTQRSIGILRELAQTRLARLRGTDAPERSAGMDVNPLEHLCQCPRASQSVLEPLNRICGRGAFSYFEQHMVTLDHAVTPAQWRQLDQIYTRLGGDNTSWGYIMGALTAYATPDFLAAIEANKGMPLSDKQIWQAMLGDSVLMPDQLPDQPLADSIMEAFATRVTGLYHNAGDEDTRIERLPLLSTGLTLHKFLELAQAGAGAKITLEDIRVPVDMSSMVNCTAANAYSLMTDYPRMARGSSISLSPLTAQGYAVSPSPAPEGGNTPERQEYRDIIRTVGAMTHSEEQFTRVMQSLSQATRIPATMWSMAFGSHSRISEHGCYAIQAVEMADNSVVINITSNPRLPTAYNFSMTIQPDGAATVTRCDLERRRV